ncbi:hypothetical protein [Nonomuraea sp. LPB2021202275-12-8]|uniref:hypothetical protein n=1 Tax=Nonomuraea sp. LPB2021202275-12-8 TaxID=3120159 RepID=UPI00300CEA2E
MAEASRQGYFRSREALLVAAAERIAELHHADMDQAAQRHKAAGARPAIQGVVQAIVHGALPDPL